MTTSTGTTRRRVTLGRIVATPQALDFLAENGVAPASLLARHVRCDWGELCAEDQKVNEFSLTHGERILSNYPVGKGRVWIITERDRSATTILLPEDY